MYALQRPITSFLQSQRFAAAACHQAGGAFWSAVFPAAAVLLASCSKCGKHGEKCMLTMPAAVFLPGLSCHERSKMTCMHFARFLSLLYCRRQQVLLTDPHCLVSTTERWLPLCCQSVCLYLSTQNLLLTNKARTFYVSIQLTHYNASAYRYTQQTCKLHFVPTLCSNCFLPYSQVSCIQSCQLDKKLQHAFLLFPHPVSS